MKDKVTLIVMLVALILIFTILNYNGKEKYLAETANTQNFGDDQIEVIDEVEDNTANKETEEMIVPPEPTEPKIIGSRSKISELSGMGSKDAISLCQDDANCYHHLALKTRDPEICYNMVIGPARDGCLTYFLNAGRLDSCDGFKNIYLEMSCKTLIKLRKIK